MVQKEVKKPGVDKNEIATIRKDFDIYWGYIQRLENPDPVLRSEAGAHGVRGLKLYDEVDRDAHAGSVLQQRILALVGKEWEIIPAKLARKLGRPASSSQEQVVADFVSEVLENCNFDQARQEILKATLYGFYAAEILWAVENNNLIISKIIGKHPRRFIFTPEREMHLLTLQDMVIGEPLPPRKFIIFTYGDSDNPYGKGLGQRLWWPVWFKKNGIKFWMVFLEKFGMPTIKGKYPSGTDPEMKKKLLEAIEAIQTDTGLTFPDTMDIEFLEASRAGTVSYEDLCKFMDNQISKAVLGQTASSEGTPGKLGESKLQENVRQEIIEADADLLDGCLNNTLIKWIVDLNFPGVTVYPKIKTYATAKPDLTAQAAIDKTLAADIGLPMTKAYFYEMYGVPVPQEGEDLIVPPPKAANPFSPGDASPAAPKLSNANFAESTIDEWIAAYMDSLQPSLQNARVDALDEIENYLRSQRTMPTEAEFTAKVQVILGNTLGSIPAAGVAATIAEMYKVFSGPAALVGFGGADIRAMNFLSQLDNFYISKWIDNPDAVAAVKAFLSERYLEGGAGLFGRGAPEDIQAFRDLFSQKLGDLEDWQVGRIIDTSVTRVQNWAAVNQFHEAGITELEIYEPTQECEFCKEMNGRVISVETAYQTMAYQTGLTPEQYSAALASVQPTSENADTLVAKGALPPYHPHCHGIVIKRVTA